MLVLNFYYEGKDELFLDDDEERKHLLNGDNDDSAVCITNISEITFLTLYFYRKTNGEEEWTSSWVAYAAIFLFARSG